MPSAFPTWILFTCYFLNSWIWVSLGDGKYPKAAVQVIPGNVIINGGNLTFRCTGKISGVRFVLYQGDQTVKFEDRTGNEAEFHFTNVQPHSAGTYICRYHSFTSPIIYSDQSDPITIQVRGTFPKPLFQVSPGSVSMRGRNLTFRCIGEQLNMKFILRKEVDVLLTEEPSGNQTVFTITIMKGEDAGNYNCLYQTKSAPLIYSDASDSRYIRVIDLPKASISLEPVQDVKGDYKIRCSAPESLKATYFFLYKEGVEAALMDRKVSSGSHSVSFYVSKDTPNTCQRCRCSYRIIESGEYLLSPLSNLLSLDDKTKKPDSTGKGEEERKETDSTEKASDNGHGGQDEKAITPKPTNTPTTIGQHTVIISIVCIAILLIVLVVATVLYRRRRSPKTKDDIQKKGLSSNEEKAEAAPESTYATIDKRKNPDNTNIPEVRESEENEDQEELTYVTVSQKSLKKKRPDQPRSDEESTVYAAVNLH